MFDLFRHNGTPVPEGEYSPGEADNLITSAEKCNEDENPKKAEKLLLRAWSILNILYSENPEKYRKKFTLCCEELGKTLEVLEKYNEANEYFNMAVEILNQLGNRSGTDIQEMLADDYINIGDTLFFRNKFDEAETNYLKALEIYDQLSNIDEDTYREDTAYCLDCLAKSFACRGNYIAAIQSYEKVITAYKYLLRDMKESIEEEHWAEYSDDLAGVYNDIGYTYSCAKDYDDAEKYYLLAASIYEKLSSLLPFEYRDQLVSQYEDLATLYGDMENSELEKEYLKKAEQPGV